MRLSAGSPSPAPDAASARAAAPPPRLKWLDLHNLLGVVTLIWAALDLAAIAILGSGLYLWRKRKN